MSEVESQKGRKPSSSKAIRTKATTGIAMLPDAVINKIAAGEVVERPFSVVKELVENAVDAGATQIDVELEQGGNQKILVTDNGSGIGNKQLELAITRHATSKIQSAADLFDIHTMGFRGEALASISEVSRFTIQSRALGASDGSRLVKEDDNGVQIFPYNGEVGTTVCVEDLFYNVPARKKFLRTSTTEYAHCSELIQALSLANPTVGFRLRHNGKQQFFSEGVARQIDQGALLGEEVIRARSKKVFGDEIVAKMIYNKRSNEYGVIEALFSPPGIDKPTTKGLFFFVNGRWVKDKSVRLGVHRGYHSHLLKNRFPLMALYLTIDPSLVDVNAHPSKTELRFQYPGEVQALIALTVRDKIRQGAWAVQTEDGARVPAFESKTPTSDRFGASVRPEIKTRTQTFSGEDKDSPFSSQSFQPKSPYSSKQNSSWEPKKSETPKPDVPPADVFDTKAPSTFAPDRLQEKSSSSLPPEKEPELFSGYFNALENTAEDSGVAQSSQSVNKISWDELEYLGCFAACFLFFETPERKLLVVDQHAFHERILYERLVDMDEMLLRSQPLLVPEALDLGEIASSKLQEHLSQLESLGFKLEFLANGAVEVLAIPSILQGRNIERIIQELGKVPPVESRKDELRRLHGPILETVACHSAVRAGEHLNESERADLLRQANGVDFYQNCPHGRRVLRVFEKREVGRWFDRL